MAYGNLGSAHGSQADFSKATEHNAKALVIAKEVGDQAGESRAYGNFGTCTYLNEHVKAVAYHKAQHALAISLRLAHVQSHAALNMGIALTLHVRATRQGPASGADQARTRAAQLEADIYVLRISAGYFWSLKLSLSRARALSLSRSLARSRSLSLTLSRARSLSVCLSVCLSPSPPFPPLPPPSLPPPSPLPPSLSLFTLYSTHTHTHTHLPPGVPSLSLSLSLAHVCMYVCIYGNTGPECYLSLS
jgi:hypothetical protein